MNCLQLLVLLFLFIVIVLQSIVVVFCKRPCRVRLLFYSAIQLYCCKHFNKSSSSSSIFAKRLCAKGTRKREIGSMSTAQLDEKQYNLNITFFWSYFLFLFTHNNLKYLNCTSFYCFNVRCAQHFCSCPNVSINQSINQQTQIWIVS